MKQLIFILLMISMSLNAHQKFANKGMSGNNHVLHQLPYAHNEEEALQQLHEIVGEYKDDCECLVDRDPKECLKPKIEKKYDELKGIFFFNNPLFVYSTSIALNIELLKKDQSLIIDQAKQKELQKLEKELQNLRKQFKMLFSEEIANERLKPNLNRDGVDL